MAATDSIGLICFDLGRVLVRICDNWQHACAVAKINPGIQQLEDTKKAALRELVVASEKGQLATDEFNRRSSELFNIPADHVAAMTGVYLLGIYPGATELIDELHSRGYRTACLSNTNATHWRQMSDPAVPCCLPLERLTYQFGSHLIGARKPDPAAYAHVERATEMSGPQIVFFDDLPENVVAAQQRGWRAHRIATDRDPVQQVREHLSRYGVL